MVYPFAAKVRSLSLTSLVVTEVGGTPETNFNFTVFLAQVFAHLVFFLVPLTAPSILTHVLDFVKDPNGMSLK